MVEEISMMTSGTLGQEGKVTFGKEKADDDKIKFDQVECDWIIRKLSDRDINRWEFQGNKFHNDRVRRIKRRLMYGCRKHESD